MPDSRRGFAGVLEVDILQRHAGARDVGHGLAADDFAADDDGELLDEPLDDFEDVRGQENSDAFVRERNQQVFDVAR